MSVSVRVKYFTGTGERLRRSGVGEELSNGTSRRIFCGRVSLRYLFNVDYKPEFRVALTVDLHNTSSDF